MTDEEGFTSKRDELVQSLREVGEYIDHKIRSMGLEPSLTITDLTLDWKPKEGWSIDMEGKGLSKDVVELIERAKNEGIVLETKQDVLDYEKTVEGPNTTGMPLSDVQAVPDTSPSSIRQELRQDEQPMSAFTDLADTFYNDLSAMGVDLSPYVALVPTYSYPINSLYRELTVLWSDDLKAMNKKKLRRHIRTLEAMVTIRDRKIKELEGE
jgi:hypothetical protein